MKPLDHLALELSPLDEADLRRIRDMSQGDFAMLLALHKAEEVELSKITDAEVEAFLMAHISKGGAA